jgi:glycerol-1-phosphate dehydrogenase [NAD(P)+]
MARYHESMNERWWRDPGLRWRSIRGLLEAAGAPMTFSELGLVREEVVEAVVRAPEIRPERVTVLHVWSPEMEEVMRMLDETGLC